MEKWKHVQPVEKAERFAWIDLDLSDFEKEHNY